MSHGNRRTLLGASAGVVVVLTALGCGEEGVTPDCPPLTLYDVRVVYGGADSDLTPEELEELREKIAEEREQAEEAGCMTPLGNEPPPSD